MKITCFASGWIKTRGIPHATDVAILAFLAYQRFDFVNDTIKLPAGVHLEDDTQVIILPQPRQRVPVAEGCKGADRGSRVERLFAALDRVREFSVAGKLTREELHAR